MHYIRLLKAPAFRYPHGSQPTSKKATNKDKDIVAPCVETVVTVSNDLGYLFYPHHITLHCELTLDVALAATRNGRESSGARPAKQRKLESHEAGLCPSQVLVERDIQWAGGMRQARVSIPLPDDSKSEQDPVFTLTISLANQKPPSFLSDGRLTAPSILGLRIERQRQAGGCFETIYLRDIPVENLVSLEKQEMTADQQPRDIAIPDSRSLPVREAPPAGSTALAAHVWDAGAAIASFVPRLFLARDSQPINGVVSPLPQLATHMQTLLQQEDGESSSPLNIVELGCGCAPLASSLLNALSQYSSILKSMDGNTKWNPREVNLILTDLPEAEETIRTNTNLFPQSTPDTNTQASLPHLTTSFVPLDWETVASADRPTQTLPEPLKNKPLALIMASDVTYNTSTTSALVATIAALNEFSTASYTAPTLTDKETGNPGSDPGKGKPYILIAYKARHDDERVFWAEMADAGFAVVEECGIWCPAFADAEPAGEEGEWVRCYLFAHTRQVLRA